MNENENTKSVAPQPAPPAVGESYADALFALTGLRCAEADELAALRLAMLYTPAEVLQELHAIAVNALRAGLGRWSVRSTGYWTHAATLIPFVESQMAQTVRAKIGMCYSCQLPEWAPPASAVSAAAASDMPESTTLAADARNSEAVDVRQANDSVIGVLAPGESILCGGNLVIRSVGDSPQRVTWSRDVPPTRVGKLADTLPLPQPQTQAKRRWFGW